MSLRSRLVAGFIAVAFALLGADIAVALLVRHSLISSVDQRLAVRGAGPRTDITATSPNNPPPFPRQSTISDLHVAYIGPDGVVQSRTAATVGQNVQPPKLNVGLVARATPIGKKPKPFSLGAEGGGPGYRAVALKTTSGGAVVIAVSLREEAGTLNKVLLVEGGATLLVLLALGLVAWWVLHLGVRPLDRMAQTADAIAAGDLSRRVDPAEAHTEVGRLGLALNKMLSEIERAVGQSRASEDRLRRFVADASHELRTPLTSIRGYAELWRQGGLETEAQVADAMRRTEQEAARMGVLVDDMLLLARLDQGRPLESVPVDLAVLADDAVADARAVEPNRTVTLDAPSHLLIAGDEGRLRQVISNLLANTRVHTPPGTSVRVRLSTEGPNAVLDVEDDGPGFGPDPQRVFERFYRADPARSRASGGVGLGLSIVASVVEAHGGHTKASATPSGGAHIRIELPTSTVARPTDPDTDQRTEQFA